EMQIALLPDSDPRSQSVDPSYSPPMKPLPPAPKRTPPAGDAKPKPPAPGKAPGGPGTAKEPPADLEPEPPPQPARDPAAWTRRGNERLARRDVRGALPAAGE